MGDFTYLGKPRLQGAKVYLVAAKASLIAEDTSTARMALERLDAALCADNVTPDDSAYDAFVSLHSAIVEGDAGAMVHLRDIALDEDRPCDGAFMAEYSLSDLAYCIDEALRELSD